MNREEITHYSRHLDRDMHIMIYGQGGIQRMRLLLRNFRPTCFPIKRLPAHKHFRG